MWRGCGVAFQSECPPACLWRSCETRGRGSRADQSREEILVDQPLLSVDRQMGLVIVTPEGKVRPYAVPLQMQGVDWSGFS